MRSNCSRTKLSRMEDFTIFAVFIFADAQVPNIIAESKGEATNCDALSFRVCIYVCMYVCIYVCISVTVNSGHFDCITATDARQRE